MGVLIGVDVGTTHLKTAAFSPDGEILAVARVPTPAREAGDGGVEYDPEELWQGVAGGLSRVGAAVHQEVDAIGVASMAETGVLIDVEGRPVYPATAWFDRRPLPHAERLARDPGTETLFLRTGLFVMGKHGLCKMLWLKETYPADFARGVTWFSVAEWIAFRLTGERAAAAPTLAARTLLYDLKQGRWAIDLASQLGIDADLLPPVVPEGSPVGGLSSRAARETGLSEGIPVTLGGHDHPCAALGAGVTVPGQLLVSTGTAEAVIGTVQAPVLTQEALGTQISQGPLPLSGLYGLQAGTPASGGSVEWLRREILPEVGYDELAALAESTGEGPSGLLYLPHLAGGGPPRVEPASRGALVGLTYATTRAHLARAILEGTGFELRLMVDAMEELVGEPFQQAVVTGGHAHARLWLQLKADILNRPVVVPQVSEATLLGAALLGAVAAGRFPDAAAAARAAYRPGRILEPRASVSAEYQRLYGIYRQLSPALRPLYRRWPAGPQ